MTPELLLLSFCWLPE